MEPGGHLTPAHVEALEAGRLATDEAEAARAHLVACWHCAQHLKLDTLGATLSGGPPTGALPPRFGRYRIVERLGAGANGVVYAAEDTELGRTVALKVLSNEGAAGGHLTLTSQARSQLLQEARAAARVQHPNVVSIYDVVTQDDVLALAMEMVPAGSLHDWLRTPRTWREKARVLLGAGRGLEAVHAAGLLHRDFKPANVLVGDEGRARVADFGLAHLTSDRTQLDGRLVGTPAYMSPQALHGEAPHPADDVYSWCATAWETLYGKRPVDGATLGELVTASMREAAPAPLGEVPRALGEVLRRGLNPRRGERASLPELLDVFSRTLSPPARAPRFIALGAVGLALGLSAVVFVSRQRTVAQCDEAAHAASPQVMQALQGTPLAQWATRWEVLRRQVCLGEVSLSAASARQTATCLDDQRLQLLNLADVALKPGRTTDQRRELFALVRSLPEPEQCVGEGANQIDTSQVIAAEALTETGHAAEAFELATRALGDGGTRLDPRLEMALRWARARALSEQGMHEAEMPETATVIALSEEVRDDRMRAAAGVLQVRSFAISRQQYDAADLMLETMRPLIARAGAPSTRIEAWLLEARIADHKSNFPRAFAALAKAEELAHATGDARRELIALAHTLDLRLANVDPQLGVESDRMWVRAKQLADQSPLGFQLVLESRGQSLVLLGRNEELHEVVAMQRALLAGDTSTRGTILQVLTDFQVLEADGDVEAAKRLLTGIAELKKFDASAGEELAMAAFEARWLTEGLEPAMVVLRAERLRLGSERSVHFEPWYLLGELLLGKWPTPPEDIAFESEHEAATHAVSAFVAFHERQFSLGREEAAAIKPPPVPNTVRTSPMWALARALRAVTLLADGDAAGAASELDAQLALLSQGPAFAASVEWTRQLRQALAACGGKAPAGTSPVAISLVETACRAQGKQ